MTRDDAARLGAARHPAHHPQPGHVSSDANVPAKRRGLAIVAVVAVAAAFAWFASGFASFTWPLRAMTGAAGVTVLGYARWLSSRDTRVRRRWWLSGQQRERHRSAVRAALVAWLGVVLVVAVVEASLVLFTSDRVTYPTISSLVDPVLHHRLVRFAAYVLWLVFGAWLVGR